MPALERARDGLGDGSDVLSDVCPGEVVFGIES